MRGRADTDGGRDDIVPFERFRTRFNESSARVLRCTGDRVAGLLGDRVTHRCGNTMACAARVMHGDRAHVPTPAPRLGGGHTPIRCRSLTGWLLVLDPAREAWVGVDLRNGRVAIDEVSPAVLSKMLSKASRQTLLYPLAVQITTPASCRPRRVRLACTHGRAHILWPNKISRNEQKGRGWLRQCCQR